MDLRRLIVTVRTWLPLMVVAALLAGAGAFAISSLQQKIYESRATLIVGQALSTVDPSTTQFAVAEGLAATYAAIATTRPIMQSLIDELSLDTSPGALAGRVRVEAPKASSFLTITAQDPDPARAASIANALGRELIAVSPAIQGREVEFQKSIDRDIAATLALIEVTQARVDALTAVEKRTAPQEDQLQGLEGRLASLRATYADLLSFSPGGAANLLTVVEPAVPAIDPVLPRTLLNMLLAAAFGLLAVGGVAFLAEQLDDSIKDPDAVREVTNFNTLGTIARMKGDRDRSAIYQLATLLYPRSGAAEAYRTLRSNVEFAAVDAPIRTLLVTSAAPGEGKTVTSANLAVVFAQAGRKVVLVDADLRKPRVHTMFNLGNARGLTTMLRGDAVRLEVLSQATEEDNLRVLTTGPLPPNPAELLGSHRMQAVVGLLTESADLVIFDSPPLQAVSDSALLSSSADGTLLVVDAGRSRGRAVRSAAEILTRAGANVLGVVLNRTPAKAHSDYVGYYGENYGAKGRVRAPDVAADRPEASAHLSGPG